MSSCFVAIKFRFKVIPVITYHPDTSEEEEELDDLEDSSEYSDWVLDEGVHLEPPKRSKRRQVTHKFTEESEDEENEEVQRPQTERKRAARYDEPSTSRAVESPVSPPPCPPKKIKKPPKPHEVPEKYKPSEWLSETKPRKSPYFPQMGDELVYFVYGHQLYVDAVLAKAIFPLDVKNLPWNRMLLKVQVLFYEDLHTICCVHIL